MGFGKFAYTQTNVDGSWSKIPFYLQSTQNFEALCEQVELKVKLTFDNIPNSSITYMTPLKNKDHYGQHSDAVGVIDGKFVVHKTIREVVLALVVEYIRKFNKDLPIVKFHGISFDGEGYYTWMDKGFTLSDILCQQWFGQIHKVSPSYGAKIIEGIIKGSNDDVREAIKSSIEELEENGESGKLQVYKDLIRITVDNVDEFLEKAKNICLELSDINSKLWKDTHLFYADIKFDNVIVFPDDNKAKMVFIDLESGLGQYDELPSNNFDIGSSLIFAQRQLKNLLTSIVPRPMYRKCDMYVDEKWKVILENVQTDVDELTNKVKAFSDAKIYGGSSRHKTTKNTSKRTIVYTLKP